MMKNIYIATGYDSFNNKQRNRAFSTEIDASKYIEGLTDPKISIIKYKSTIDLVNHFLRFSHA
jgi:hypothetical protein